MIQHGVQGHLHSACVGAGIAIRVEDDILAIGNITAINGTTTVTASGPADAFVIGVDQSLGAGLAQDISAYTTFIKVN